MRRIDWSRDDAGIDHGDDLRLEFQGEPFTGEVVEEVDGELLSQDFYTNGVPDGPTREWWPNGRLRAEGEVRFGLPRGVFREWHENGRLAVEKHFDDAGAVATALYWDEKGTPIDDRPS